MNKILVEIKAAFPFLWYDRKRIYQRILNIDMTIHFRPVIERINIEINFEL